MTIREITGELMFPEGPVAMDDGSVIVVEIEAGRLTRVKPDGSKHTIATVGGGPNGLAIGPDGALYVCNNGENFEYHKQMGLNIPGHTPPHHAGGWIERVEIASGKVERLYTEWNGVKLQAPNDIVFDTIGGFWFTDHGSTTHDYRTHGALYYARADGSKIERVLYELVTPNGVGLSPAGDAVYYAETFTGRLYKLPLTAPGVRGEVAGFTPGQFVGAFPGLAYFDSLGVQADGHVCCATLLAGGITTFDPATGGTTHFALPDPLVTNICWGGKDMKTAFITASGTGKLLAVDWPAPGLRLNYNG
jgi:gluconolactonase